MDPPDSPASRSGVSPLKAFLIILALIILSTVIFLMAANSEGSPEGTQTQSNAPPDFSLTDEEAIARFEELNELRLRSYAERDLSLVSLYVTSDSPLNGIIRKEIRRLIRADVLDRTTFLTKGIEVTSNDADAIELTQRVIEEPKFIDEAGIDVTADRFRELRTIEWTLRPEAGTWKVFEIRVIDAEVL